MIYEPLEDALAEDDAAPERLDRIAHIDRAIAAQVLRNTESIEDVHHRLDGLASAVDRNTDQSAAALAKVEELVRERDLLRAKVGGAKWVLVTLGLGTVYFFRDILEFVGLVRDSSR